MRKIVLMVLMMLCLSTMLGAADDSPDITPAPGQVNPYRTRSELLMDASAYVGVTSPERAAEIWAEGLLMRSAAMQYIVMTRALRADYANGLDDLRSNWVTGMSSPSVGDYAITQITSRDHDHTEITLRVELSAPSFPSEFHHATLFLTVEDGFWRIERVQADEALYYYTLYRP